MQKLHEKIMQKNKRKLCEKQEHFAKKYKNFKNKCKMFAKAIAKIHQERLNFENTRRIFNKGLIRPIDGLSRNIKRQDV